MDTRNKPLEANEVIKNIQDAFASQILALSKGTNSSSVRFGSIFGSENDISSCEIDMGNIKIGNVNINNRIFTNSRLEVLGKNQYKITAREADEDSVSAVIDKIRYEGKEILVTGKVVNVVGATSEATPEISDEASKARFGR